MAKRTRRKNEAALTWLRAAGVAAATLGALMGMHFAPLWGALTLATVAGILALVSMDLGVLAAIIAMALPITAANPIAGILFAVLGIVGVRYLGADGGRVFLLVAAAVAGAFFGPVWAPIAVAAYLMSVGEGALAAAIACVSVQVVGIALGRTAAINGSTVLSGTKPLVAFENAPVTMFSPEWVGDSFSSIGTQSVDQVINTASKAQHLIAFAVQPAVWALAAAVAAIIVRESRKRRSGSLLYVGAATSVAIAALGSVAVHSLAGVPVRWDQLAAATVSSLILGLGFVLLFEKVFPLEVAPVSAPKAQNASSMATEDADVDELLRLIATAEEKLASQHTTTRVVMITDMKSFSRMTEEDGSILTAKAIQRHRDLLLPVIERHGGSGKSTGGDGLVASFTSPESALSAAAEMQRILHEYNDSRSSERDISVRIGVADGEVVLDKGGRPFIGAALNLAARVMNLADGGQVFTTRKVADEAGASIRVYSHGDFQLKNIARPVEVLEVLWSDAMEARDPRERLAAE